MTTITAADGVALEARWDRPAGEPHTLAVLCHPHPLYGGTMDAPLVVAVARYLVEYGFAVLRFNFRGVGASEGAWSGGAAEVHDVTGAVAAATALRWQAASGSTLPWAGIAPPVRLDPRFALPDPGSLPEARRLFVIGDRDQYTAADDLAGYARRARSRVEVLKGSDHFFYFRERVVGGLVAAHLATRPEA
jgi:alpha/beta superfamily hydrolase